MARKAVNGSGSIRKKEVVRNGKKYVYWEARYSAGRDPLTGKLVQKSISGKTQKEVATKLKAATAEANTTAYIKRNTYTVKQWIELWTDTYLIDCKETTIDKYKRIAKMNIFPALGNVRINKLEQQQVQKFINAVSKEYSASVVHNVQTVLHRSLQQAVDNKLLQYNPADKIILPKPQKVKLQYLEPEQVRDFINALDGEKYRNFFIVALMTGMRLSELIGLSWDNVNFETGTITVAQQYQYLDGVEKIVLPKEDKIRTIIPAKIVMDALANEKETQRRNAIENSDVFQNEWNLCFTRVSGKPYGKNTIENRFKKILKSAELPNIRFHDLRHSFAVNSIQAGDDIKTIQSNLGHATAAFTLDVYSSTVNAMRKKSSERMQQFYDDLMFKKDDKNSD